MMPPQLARAKRPRGSTPRPLAECLPRINVNDLKIPKSLNTVVTAPWVSLRYPFISGARFSVRVVEFAYSGRIQSFPLKWIKTGYGLPRFAFVCQCGRPLIFLYFRYDNLSCRRCVDAIYASQILSRHKRPAPPNPPHQAIPPIPTQPHTQDQTAPTRRSPNRKMRESGSRCGSRT